MRPSFAHFFVNVHEVTYASTEKIIGSARKYRHRNLTERYVTEAAFSSDECFAIYDAVRAARRSVVTLIGHEFLVDTIARAKAFATQLPI